MMMLKWRSMHSRAGRHLLSPCYSLSDILSNLKAVKEPHSVKVFATEKRSASLSVNCNTTTKKHSLHKPLSFKVLQVAGTQDLFESGTLPRRHL